jgi:hypothetical protein
MDYLWPEAIASDALSEFQGGSYRAIAAGLRHSDSRWGQWA